MDDPRAAADYCQDYIPDCDSPLPYSTQSLDHDEVSDSSVSVTPHVVKKTSLPSYFQLIYFTSI